MLNSGQARSQRRRRHGFREVFVASGFQSAFPIGFLPITRHGDDPGRLKTSVLSQPSCDFIAIEMWEADVQKHDVGSLFLGCGQCGESIVDFHDAMAVEREESGHHLGRIHIVINNENAQRGTRSLNIARMRNDCEGRLVFEHRKADDKLRTCPTTLAVGQDCPAMHFDQLADKGEPDSEPPLAAFQRRFSLSEWFKDIGQDPRINADAVISHTDQEVVFLDTRRQPDAPSSIRELRGVV